VIDWVLLWKRMAFMPGAMPLTDDPVDLRVGLAAAFFVGVDDEVAKVGELVGILFALARADEAVAQDRGLTARAQPAEVVDEFGLSDPMYSSQTSSMRARSPASSNPNAAAVSRSMLARSRPPVGSLRP
jgi:hypothetical protein